MYVQYRTSKGSRERKAVIMGRNPEWHTTGQCAGTDLAQMYYRKHSNNFVEGLRFYKFPDPTIT